MHQAEIHADAKVQATTLIVSETTGRGYKRDNFQHRFADIRRAAAAGIRDGSGRWIVEPCPEVDGLLFMHLRHTAITRLAEANCAFGVIASVSGHQPDSIGQILNRYWQPTSRQAQEAFRRRAEHEGEG